MVLWRSLAAALVALIPLSVSGERVWGVSVWGGKGPLPTDLVTRSVPVYALASQVAVVAVEPEEEELLRAKGFDFVPLPSSSSSSSPSSSPSSWALVEISPRVMREVQEAFRIHPALEESLVLGLFKHNIAIVKSGQLLDDDNLFPWASKVEVLPLSASPIVPSPAFEESPLYPRLSNLNFNPAISEVIGMISPDMMLASVITLSEGFYSRQSASAGIRKAQDYLIAHMRQLGLRISTHSYRNDYAENICGDLVGRVNPEHLVITGAHYDSRAANTNDPSLRAPGAVDNGSGTAGMLEMARVLVESGIQVENTIRICLWTGEEQGLLGSKAYAAKLKTEDANVLAYFNADMTGYQLPNTTITLGMKDKSITEWLLELSYDITAMYVPNLPVALSASCCSDYISFFEQGYPSIGYFQNAGAAGDYPDYHKVTDTYEKNNYEQMRLETQAVLAAVLTFAVPLEGN